MVGVEGWCVEQGKNKGGGETLNKDVLGHEVEVCDPVVLLMFPLSLSLSLSLLVEHLDLDYYVINF